MTEAEQIAAKLTEAQRKVVLSKRDYFTPHKAFSLPMIGLVQRSPIAGMWKLAPLGLQVRVILERQL